MGAWGVQSFENDDAVDWLSDLRRSTGMQAILSAVAVVAELETDSYLEVPEASVAVAAAEVVAALLGRPTSNLPPDVTAWVDENRQVGAPEGLRDSAQRAVARAQLSSELRDLWDESDDGGAASQQLLSDLMARLSS